MQRSASTTGWPSSKRGNTGDMIPRAPTVLALLLVVGACSTGLTQSVQEPAPSLASEVEGGRIVAESYDYDAPIPKDAGGLAAELEEVSRELRVEIDRWIEGGTEPGPPARPVLLRSVRQQRIYRTLVDRPKVFEQVRDVLPRGLRLFASKTVQASTRLRTLVSPLDGPPDWTIYKPAPARRLLRFFRAGERRFDISWEVLASLNFVESRFGRILGPSSAGAEGPMQFLPSTWAVYGNGGDINDPHDSILGAARYLSASGAPARMWDALFAYNRSNAYVKAILIYARQMMRDPKAFYSYYHWQVYVLTKDGDLQLSGPGADI